MEKLWTGRFKRPLNEVADEEVATFEADEVFDQKDAEGFINLYGLSSKVYAMMRRKNGLPLR